MFITWSNYTGIIQQRTDQRQFAFSSIIPDFPAIAQCPYCWCSSTDGLSMESFNGQTNWAFADGHAKSMPRTATMDPSWLSNQATAIATFKKNLFEAATPGYN
jgi:prepilin-type processing-associated H-X9-DG protein